MRAKQFIPNDSDAMHESVAGPEKCWPGHRKVGTQPGTGKNAGKRVNDCEKIKEQDVAEGNYDRDDYYNARRGSEYGRGLAATGYGGDGSGTRRDDIFKGQSKRLPADPFARTTGAVPKTGTGRIHSTALPGEMEEGEKIGNMDADRFDDAMARLKKLAGAGPMKTVYDPDRRVYRNMPTAQQPAQQPKK